MVAMLGDVSAEMAANMSRRCFLGFLWQVLFCHFEADRYICFYRRWHLNMLLLIVIIQLCSVENVLIKMCFFCQRRCEYLMYAFRDLSVAKFFRPLFQTVFACSYISKGVYCSGWNCRQKHLLFDSCSKSFPIRVINSLVEPPCSTIWMSLYSVSTNRGILSNSIWKFRIFCLYDLSTLP